MLKRNLAFFLLLLLVPILVLKTRDLTLNFYVLSSFFVFFLFYLYLENARVLFFSGLIVFVFVSIFFFVRHPGIQILILHGGQWGLLMALIGYKKKCQDNLGEVASANQEALSDLELLKRKHAHRQESLLNLEKQVSSLMDLFEIARDFSDCLSFPGIVDLLHKRVMPELPFQKMRLMLIKHPDQTLTVTRFFKIVSEGVWDCEPEISETDRRLMQEAAQTGRLERDCGLWIFPVLVEKKAVAFLSVEGAEETDLAKFEVLVSHLVLQIKKINLYGTVKELSIIDGLTQIFLRRHFMEMLESELKRSIKHELSLALLILDIDHFKRYNDEFGHLVGDGTLREVASILRSNLRKVDIVARYGGEEFIIVIPEATKEGAREVAERIRSNIARHFFKIYNVTTRVTVSTGISLFPEDVSTEEAKEYQKKLPAELIRKADIALYRAKEEGRNRVVMFHQL